VFLERAQDEDEHTGDGSGTVKRLLDPPSVGASEEPLPSPGRGFDTRLSRTPEILMMPRNNWRAESMDNFSIYSSREGTEDGSGSLSRLSLPLYNFPFLVFACFHFMLYFPFLVFACFHFMLARRARAFFVSLNG
jgi:hypothetical protein